MDRWIGMIPASFEIDETHDGGLVRLTVRGELDLASTRVLEDRLTRLRAKKRPALLDLSQVEFIDSTGLHLLIRSMGDARTDGWELQIEPHVSATVSQLFKLVHFDPFTPAPVARGSHRP